MGKASQRSLARAALLEGTEQINRALDQIATLPTTLALRLEKIKLEVAFANALALTGDPVGGEENYDRRSQFTIQPNTVRLRRALAGMSV